jgi:Arc/MetJ-type ribon-helix-helix transcriptional regulator
MSRAKVSLSLDPSLIQEVDAYVASNEGADRSKVVDQALYLWSEAQQRHAMELQFADEADADRDELAAWRQVRRQAADRRLKHR